MAKRDISKLLATGSPKQRMRLICEYKATASYGRPAPLTENEYIKLMDSFKSSYEVKLFNKMADQEKAIRFYLPSIQTSYFMYKTKILNLKGLCMLWIEYKREEDLFNEILLEVREEALKKEIKQIIKKSRMMLWAEILEDKEGFLEVVTNRPRKTKKNDLKANYIEHEGEVITLEKAIKKLSQEAADSLSNTKTMIEVVREFMGKTNEIKGYKKMLEELEEPLYVSESPLPIFNKRFFMGHEDMAGLPLPEERMANIKKYKMASFQEDIEIFSKYWVFPDYNEIPINEEYFNSEYNAVFKPQE